MSSYGFYITHEISKTTNLLSQVTTTFDEKPTFREINGLSVCLFDPEMPLLTVFI